MNEQSDVEEVTRLMRRVAEQMHSNVPLPDADVVLARARFLERQRDEERALRPVLLSWKFTKYWLIAVGVVGCARLWPHVTAFADGFGARLIESIGSLVSAPSTSNWVPILALAFVYTGWRIARDVATVPKS
jgi:hypothetical protein